MPSWENWGLRQNINHSILRYGHILSSSSHHVLQAFVLTVNSFILLLIPSTAIREYDAKLLLAYWLNRVQLVDPSLEVAPAATPAYPRVAQLLFDEDTHTLTPKEALPKWLQESGVKLVAKPDQLIKRRGKAGLLALNKSFDEAKEWIDARAGKVQKVCTLPVHLVSITFHFSYRFQCLFHIVTGLVVGLRLRRNAFCSTRDRSDRLLTGRVRFWPSDLLHPRTFPSSPFQHRILRLHQLFP